MDDIYLHNTLTGKKEKFKPINEKEIGIYSCGPTVYWNQHIGHMYAYVQWDAMNRALKYFGYKTKWVMNITDVGHLTGDNEGDADTGEDKLEKGARKEGLSVWQIADKYTRQFEQSLKLLNIKKPDVLSRATEHIPEQIELIKRIEKNGFAYKTRTGLVFDTQKFPGYDKFANLNLDEQKSGARVEVDAEKKRPWDFLLWITNQPEHIMKWSSPWGVGFPGWHIECTAMSTKYLGETFDIHTGGKEHIPVHHTNEIAQGYGAFGHQTANFWLHNEWLLFRGEKVSKSTGNAILASDLKKEGRNLMALRYLFLTSHYKTGLNFSYENLEGAETAYRKLKEAVSELRKSTGLARLLGKSLLPKEDEERFIKYRNEFKMAVADDLNFAKALGVLWQAVKDKDIGDRAKLGLILDFDKVFALKLGVAERPKKEKIPENILELKKERDLARSQKDFQKSDSLRKKIEESGYIVEDKGTESLIRKKF